MSDTIAIPLPGLDGVSLELPREVVADARTTMIARMQKVAAEVKASGAALDAAENAPWHVQTARRARYLDAIEAFATLRDNLKGLGVVYG